MIPGQAFTMKFSNIHWVLNKMNYIITFLIFDNNNWMKTNFIIISDLVLKAT